MSIYTVKIPPHIDTITRHTWTRKKADEMTDNELIKATAYTLAANLMIKRAVTPLGTTNANRHVLTQVGADWQKEAYLKELNRRRPDVVIFIDYKKKASPTADS